MNRIHYKEDVFLEVHHSSPFDLWFVCVPFPPSTHKKRILFDLPGFTNFSLIF